MAGTTTKCIHCSLELFSYKSKKTANVKLRNTDITVLEAISDLTDVSLTPVAKEKASERSLCMECFGLLGSLVRTSKALKELKVEFQRKQSADSWISRRVKRSSPASAPAARQILLLATPKSKKRALMPGTPTTTPSRLRPFKRRKMGLQTPLGTHAKVNK